MTTSARTSEQGERLSVVIAHGAPLVVAGLASTLERVGCDVAVADAGAWSFEPHGRVVFGDWRLWTEATRPSTLQEPRARRSRFVLVTSSEQRARCPASSRRGIDEWLTIDCGEAELFATVERLRNEMRHGTRRDADIGSDRGGIAPFRLNEVRAYVDGHLGERLDLAVLAGVARLSCCHFARAFKQSTGVPPHRYVTERRVLAATRMIRETDRRLADIAIDVGFSDQSHFTRTFARIAGETPRAFRRRHR